MRNLDFLAKMLTSKSHYWIVAKKNEGLRNETFKDSIIFIALPHEIQTGMERSTILLTDLEKLARARMDSNIFLNEEFSPFQQYIQFHDVYDGFELDNQFGLSIKEILIKALSIKSNSIHEYKKLLSSKS